jgi:transglutaminase-like putative cysteine protease
MSLEVYFRAFSYATVAVATLTLMLAGGLSVGLGVLVLFFMAAAWGFEGTRWQLSERTGLVVVLLSIPLFFLDWHYQKTIGEPAARVGVNALAHLIVFLAVVKLLQVKKDRDWVFLYLISFFEVLLAAGLSVSPVFLASLTIYLLCGLSTIIAFEIQKSRRAIAPSETNLLVPPDSRIFKNSARRRSKGNAEAQRLPFVALGLLLLIIVLAVPLFLVAPRSGAAALIRGGAGLTNVIGFSDSVTLGEIGTLKRDNAIVMRVRTDDQETGRQLRWRGVALDEFNLKSWKKSKELRLSEKPAEGNGPLFRVATVTTEALNRLTTQTVFLEPIESPVLFAAYRPIAIQGNFSRLWFDAEGSLQTQTRRGESERVMYKARSDMTEPEATVLRSDARSDPANFERYKQLPALLDPRILALANGVVAKAQARNRYDEAKAIESHLQLDYGYSLEMKASGPDPLADFLFNVKTGHCEYFSTAMAVMLRTRGIPARVVNGFLPGEYNDAADAYTVRQSDAHSWVEVYFPETASWVTFDPTPMAGRTEPVSTGLAAQAGKYAEALELIWFQYVVGYDKQEQRSLATSLQGGLIDLRRSLALMVAAIQRAIFSETKFLTLLGLGLAGALLLVLAAKRVRKFGWRRGLRIRPGPAVAPTSTVLFYERLTALLARRGVERDSHLTPLEFAGNLDFQPAMAITQAYNRVRFGGLPLSAAELREIEETLRKLEAEKEV